MCGPVWQPDRVGLAAVEVSVVREGAAGAAHQVGADREAPREREEVEVREEAREHLPLQIQTDGRKYIEEAGRSG